MNIKRNTFIPVLAFFLSICSLAAVPLTSVVNVQQKTETVNTQQPAVVVRFNFRVLIRDVMPYGPVLFELHSTPAELFAFPQMDTRFNVVPPVLPVLTHRPFT